MPGRVRLAQRLRSAETGTAVAPTSPLPARVASSSGRPPASPQRANCRILAVWLAAASRSSFLVKRARAGERDLGASARPCTFAARYRPRRIAHVLSRRSRVDRPAQHGATERRLSFLVALVVTLGKARFACFWQISRSRTRLARARSLESGEVTPAARCAAPASAVAPDRRLSTAPCHPHPNQGPLIAPYRGSPSGLTRYGTVADTKYLAGGRATCRYHLRYRNCTAGAVAAGRLLYALFTQFTVVLRIVHTNDTVHV